MKSFSESAQRNRQPIAAALAGVLPTSGLVLEIASGTGEHAVYMARSYAHLDWQPSDCSAESLASIAAWVNDVGLSNLRLPMHIAADDQRWPVPAADVVLCVNMTHISPWGATEGLFRNARAVLPVDGSLIIYGPFREPGMQLVPSNAMFDQDLRRRDPQWGLRSISQLDWLAIRYGFRRSSRIEMPANNLTLVYTVSNT